MEEKVMVIIRPQNSLWTSADILVQAPGRGGWLVLESVARQLATDLGAEGVKEGMDAEGTHKQLVIYGEEAYRRASSDVKWNFINGVLKI